MLCVALVAWTGFQTFHLVRERELLKQTLTNQEPLVQNSMKLRSSLDSLAAATQRLAERGNPNAKLLVDELRKHGVTIRAGGQ
jgi:hypothetical protein